MANRIILDMSNEEYHAHPAISNTGLGKIAKSPAHYRWYKENGSADSEAFQFGSAFHTLLLEPSEFSKRVELWSGAPRNTKAGKDDYAAALASGKLPIKQDDYAAMLDMCKAINAHVSSRVYLSGKGKVEASLFWADEETGVECRCRPDWMRDDGVLVDLKTTKDASPEEYGRSAYNYRYHVQAAFYMMGCKTVTGKDCPAFAFVAVEKDAPHGVTLWIADEAMLEAGRREVRRCLERYAIAQKANRWDCYPDVPLALSLPAWAINNNQGVNAYV